MNSTEQVYNLDNGIFRMLVDLKSYLRPFFVSSQPLLSALVKINYIFIPILFVLLLLYTKLYRKHKFIRKIKNKNTIYGCVAGLVAYCLLIFAKVDFGHNLGINLGNIVLPTIAKVYGPLIACVFAVFQAILSATLKVNNINLLVLFVAAITGLLYGIFLYRRRSKYSTCLIAKIFTNLFCNSFLAIIAIVSAGDLSLSEHILSSAVPAVLMAPVQAAILFLIFRFIRLVKNNFHI